MVQLQLLLALECGLARTLAQELARGMALLLLLVRAQVPVQAKVPMRAQVPVRAQGRVRAQGPVRTLAEGQLELRVSASQQVQTKSQALL